METVWVSEGKVMELYLWLLANLIDTYYIAYRKMYNLGSFSSRGIIDLPSHKLGVIIWLCGI